MMGDDSGVWPLGRQTPFQPGDRVRITDGPFENLEGIVETADAQRGMVRVRVTISDRPTPLDIRPWQLKPVRGR